MDVSPFWLPLIRELSRELERLIRRSTVPKDEWPYAYSVKEKHGALRFMLSSGTDEMYQLIEECEDKSETICELCGRDGKPIFHKGWWSVMCDECKEKRKPDEKV